MTPGKRRRSDARKKRNRVTRREIVYEFLGGLSFVGLARKHGKTAIEIEAIVRDGLWRW